MLICTVTIYEVLATSQGSSVNKTPVPAFAELAILCAQSLSCARHFATPLAVAHQAPTSMGFSRQECWSGLPRPPPGDLPDSRIEPVSPEFLALQADSLLLSHQGSPIGYTIIQNKNFKVWGNTNGIMRQDSN